MVEVTQIRAWTLGGGFSDMITGLLVGAMDEAVDEVVVSADAGRIIGREAAEDS